MAGFGFFLALFMGLGVIGFLVECVGLVIDSEPVARVGLIGVLIFGGLGLLLAVGIMIAAAGGFLAGAGVV